MSALAKTAAAADTDEAYVLIWHNMKWMVWAPRGTKDEQLAPIKEAKEQKGNKVEPLVLAPDMDAVFGPCGSPHANRWDYLLPAWVPEEAELGTFRMVHEEETGDFELDSGALPVNSVLQPGTWEPIGFELTLGVATIAVVLMMDSKTRVSSIAKLLHGRFEKRFRDEYARLIGRPSFDLGRAVQLAGTATKSDYLFVKAPEAELGSGGFAFVFLGLELRTQKVYAFKWYKKTPAKEEEGAPWTQVINKREIDVLKTLQELNNDHIVKFQDLLRGGRVLVMEYMPLGAVRELHGLDHTTSPWPTRDILLIAQQICNALQAMEERFGMAHGDVQLGNILIRKAEPLEVVLADFGFASTANTTPQYWGAPLYQAPEIVIDSGGPKADIWSLGICLYQFGIGKFLLFEAEDHEEPYLNVLFEFHYYKHLLDRKVCKLLEGMLQPNHASRLSAGECVSLAGELLALEN